MKRSRDASSSDPIEDDSSSSRSNDTKHAAVSPAAGPWARPGVALHAYQQDALAWMRARGIREHHGARGGILNAEMGLGKTLMMIAHILNTRIPGTPPALVVVSLEVMGAWKRELDKFVLPGVRARVLLHHPSYATETPLPTLREQLCAGDWDLVLTTYERVRHSFTAASEILTGIWRVTEDRSAWWTVATAALPCDPTATPAAQRASLFHSVDWSVLVIDESQRAANPTTSTYKALMCLSVPSRARWLLTGTIMRNYSTDYYAQLMLCGFDAVPRKRRWSTPAGVCSVFRDYAIDRELVRNISAAAVGIALPPLREHTRAVTLNETERANYDRLEGALNGAVVRHRNGEALWADVLAVLGALRRATIAPVLENVEEVREAAPSMFGTDGTGASRIQATVELVRELTATQDRKIVVFSNFQSALALLDAALNAAALPRNARILRIDGSVRATHRTATLARFRSTALGPVVLLLSARVGGEGLNLQEASAGILLDPHWTKADERQQRARFHRPGQTATDLDWYRMCAAGTIEEYVLQVCDRKLSEEATIVTRGLSSSPSASGPTKATLRAYLTQRKRTRTATPLSTPTPKARILIDLSDLPDSPRLPEAPSTPVTLLAIKPEMHGVRVSEADAEPSKPSEPSEPAAPLPPQTKSEDAHEERAAAPPTEYHTALQVKLSFDFEPFVIDETCSKPERGAGEIAEWLTSF